MSSIAIALIESRLASRILMYVSMAGHSVRYRVVNCYLQILSRFVMSVKAIIIGAFVASRGGVWAPIRLDGALLGNHLVLFSNQRWLLFYRPLFA